MSTIYIVRVYEGNVIYEYEFGNENHALELLLSETESAELWKHNTETEVEEKLR